jgi:hypothetical protein
MTRSLKVIIHSGVIALELEGAVKKKKLFYLTELIWGIACFHCAMNSTHHSKY